MTILSEILIINTKKTVKPKLDIDTIPLAPYKQRSGGPPSLEVSHCPPPIPLNFLTYVRLFWFF